MDRNPARLGESYRVSYLSPLEIALLDSVSHLAGGGAVLRRRRAREAAAGLVQIF